MRSRSVASYAGLLTPPQFMPSNSGLIQPSTDQLDPSPRAHAFRIIEEVIGLQKSRGFSRRCEKCEYLQAFWFLNLTSYVSIRCSDQTSATAKVVASYHPVFWREFEQRSRHGKDTKVGEKASSLFILPRTRAKKQQQLR